MIEAHATPRGHTLPAAAGEGAREPVVLSLPLVLVNQSRANDKSLDIARREARAIWETAGLRLVWTAPEISGDSSRFSGVFIVVRTSLFPESRPKLEVSRHDRVVMGRVMFGDTSPGRLIEVSLPAIERSVHKAADAGPRGTALLAVAGRGAVGRALGRVIAHEIGHWLFGRGHTETGLMRATLYPRDLIAPKRPPLPRGWRAADVAHLRALQDSAQPDFPLRKCEVVRCNPDEGQSSLDAHPRTL